MIAGRELDALVAEKVMGWRREDKAMMHGIIQTVFVDTKTDHARSITCGCVEDFHPSKDISAAWLVVEKMAQDGDEHPTCIQKGLPAFGDHATPFEVYKNYAGYPGWTCYFHDYEVCAHADTAPLAICLAALKAVGVEMEKS